MGMTSGSRLSARMGEGDARGERTTREVGPARERLAGPGANGKSGRARGLALAGRTREERRQAKGAGPRWPLG